jgi:hypothetical protein
MKKCLSLNLSKLHPPKTAALILLLTVAILASLILPAPLFAQIEAGPCEWALALCARDALYLQFPSDYMINCMIGYAFCKKYIES